MYICISKLNIIGSDNGLSPGQRQAVVKTNAGILLIWPLGINFSEMLMEIHTFSFKQIHLKMSSVKQWPVCPSLNVLKEFQCTDINPTESKLFYSYKSHYGCWWPDDTKTQVINKCLPSNLWYKAHPISKHKCFSSCLAVWVVFAQSIEASC